MPRPRPPGTPDAVMADAVTGVTCVGDSVADGNDPVLQISKPTLPPCSDLCREACVQHTESLGGVLTGVLRRKMLLRTLRGGPKYPLSGNFGP